MLLLWLGAAISISEIFTGGLLAPLGMASGLAAIIIGHLIGTGLLALGGYVSFCRKASAMESVACSFGSRGGKLIAFCNVVQLTGWTIVMIVQGVSAIRGVFPAIPFMAASAVLSSLVLLWALSRGSPAARLNDIVVVLLALLCVVWFAEVFAMPGGFVVADNTGGGSMSMALAVEISIAMPVSWLPLVGDYAKDAKSGLCAAGMPFAGYFTGSIFMYALGLLIGISGGGDIFAFIGASRFRFAACMVVVLSTMTTAFLDLYSAAVSSRQLVKSKNKRLPVLVIGIFAVLVSTCFPAEKYGDFLTAFLTAIGMVFVPVYTVLFLDFMMRKNSVTAKFRPVNFAIALTGMIGYRIFSAYAPGFTWWIPTLLSMALAAALYLAANLRRMRETTTPP
jgi:putative hydroxymethylpyrimidine transporter CytX